MKVRIQKIRAPEPRHYDHTGKAVSWTPMVIEVLVEPPKDEGDAARQLIEARSWAFLPVRHGARIPAPPVLELLPEEGRTE